MKHAQGWKRARILKSRKSLAEYLVAFVLCLLMSAGWAWLALKVTGH